MAGTITFSDGEVQFTIREDEAKLFQGLRFYAREDGYCIEEIKAGEHTVFVAQGDAKCHYVVITDRADQFRKILQAETLYQESNG